LGGWQNIVISNVDTAKNKEFEGKNIIEGEYIEDKEHGKWIISSGDIIISGFYEYGEKTKTWESFYISGNKQFKGKYFNGKPNGTHQFFYENGKLEHEEKYIRGKSVKAWSYYNEKGDLLYVVYYKKGKEDKIIMANNLD